MIISLIAKGLFGIIPGMADSYMKNQQNMAVQGTKRSGIWATALTDAAQADIENRKTAAAERSSSPFIMALYILAMIGPVTYYLMFWMDTIFANQVWSIPLYFTDIVIWDWTTYELQRAPDRLEEMGAWLIGVLVGANTAMVGVVKGAKALGNLGFFKGK